MSFVTYITPVLFGETLFAHARINLAREFINRGFDFQIIAPLSPKASETLSNHDIPHRLYSWLDFPGLSTFTKSRGAASELRNSIRKNSPDIVISELRISSKKMAKIFTQLKEKKPTWIIDDRSPPVMEGFLGKLQLSHYDYVVPKLVKFADSVIVQNSQHQNNV